MSRSALRICGITLALLVAGVMLKGYIKPASKSERSGRGGLGESVPEKQSAPGGLEATVGSFQQSTQTDADRRVRQRFNELFPAYAQSYREIAALRLKVKQDNPELAVAWEMQKKGRQKISAMRNELGDKFEEVLSVFPPEVTEVEDRRRQLVAPALLLAALDSHEPVGDRTLGEITLQTLTETDLFDFTKDRLIKLARERSDSAAVRKLEVIERPEDLISALRDVADSYQAEFKRVHEPRIREPQLRQFLGKSFEIDYVDGIFSIYDKSRYVEVRKLEAERDKLDNEINSLLESLPTDSDERTAINTEISMLLQEIQNTKVAK